MQTKGNRMSIFDTVKALVTTPANYAIVKHHPRQVGTLHTVPDTVGMADRVGGGDGKGSVIKIFDNIWRHIRNINSDRGYNYARSVGAMWINGEYGTTPTDYAKAESITCGGNFVRILKWDSGYAEIASFNYRRTLPIPIWQNWQSAPHLHFKAVAINSRGDLSNVANNLDVYFPVLRQTGRFMHWTNVEEFPIIPPGGMLLTRKADGKQIRILDYRCRGASVQGLTVAGSWIYLLKCTQPGERIFPFADWSLETVGVIPPPKI